MGTVVTSGSLGDVTVSSPAQNAKDVCLIPTLGAIFSIFITPVTIFCCLLIVVVNIV